MTLTYATLRIDLPFVESKKGRRAVLQSIKDRLAKMNCSLLDLSGEYPKEGEIAIAFLSTDAQQAKQKIEKIETMLESRYPDIQCELEYELY
ncbi:DUF503 family protein [Hydrogenimonas sp.]|uniref:DUF503 family protein n=1 Tax=Hydrogenimonas sp. TaxID=2231112 RepID=UPI002601BB04|nr:DUF503 family protein [Hydrogenimonas sp.]